ncbi:hypothetical protein PHYBLDRAFT_167038 [Phycomyces blakesleeanus NRRL 1555(-)]|uniref:Uncharacterized protein n=1 Tax=Phycomyces blakesleeanus (strain ATCC 8743b / DSM 1359 / FGSC 10004 / NBRC 33097 / NRRL 1555) TaxID=763407 RepID=A0A167N0J0_PHYB8|nr:hypothetical protein PHYBLDRAFT_167038 [Phycomyces blakesleeanus NRRL 1555(-)]OAD74689.1 hypothetical protein PHYBLDRAFT_167038 [Phycomyces blakesleeanus NRRL 1555(-)]|eukprot:XP_018292729.1 hypothetical protein PHYBLDRAFT_167038 [Phycomyces blakesleeanus NRRL 1555(-)]
MRLRNGEIVTIKNELPANQMQKVLRVQPLGSLMTMIQPILIKINSNEVHVRGTKIILTQGCAVYILYSRATCGDFLSVYCANTTVSKYLLDILSIKNSMLLNDLDCNHNELAFLNPKFL